MRRTPSFNDKYQSVQKDEAEGSAYNSFDANDTTNRRSESLSESMGRKLLIPGACDGSPAVLPTPVRNRQNRRGSTAELEPPNATTFSTTMNMINTIFGAGMLSLPYAFSQSGIGIGLFFFIFAGFGEALAVRLLVKCVLKEKKYSFRALARKALPFSSKRSKQVMETLVAVNCFGLATSYLVVMGDLLPQVVHYFSPSAPAILRSRQIWVTILGCGTCLPLMLPSTLEALKFTSTLGVISIFYILSLTVLYGVDYKDPCAGATKTCPGDFEWGLPGDIPAMLKVLSMYSFAYSCTQNMPSLVYEMKDRTQRKLDVAVFSSITFSTCGYILCAYMGYRAFGDYVQADLLASLPKSILATVARLVIVGNLITTYPLQMLPTKNSLCQLICDCDSSQLPWHKYLICVVGIFSLSYGVGMVVKDLSIVLAFVGATTSTILGYILPAWFYIKLFPESKWERYLAWFIVIVGLILVPTLVIIEILQIVHII